MDAILQIILSDVYEPAAPPLAPTNDFDAYERTIFDISSFVAGFNEPRIHITSVSSYRLSAWPCGIIQREYLKFSD